MFFFNILPFSFFLSLNFKYVVQISTPTPPPPFFFFGICNYVYAIKDCRMYKHNISSSSNFYFSNTANICYSTTSLDAMYVLSHTYKNTITFAENITNIGSRLDATFHGMITNIMIYSSYKFRNSLNLGNCHAKPL